MRRYEGIDQSRKDELTQKVREDLVPRLSKLPGFSSYFLIESGNGVLTSFGIFETSTQGEESSRVAANWVRDEKLESALPNGPKVTDGEIVVHQTTKDFAVA
ncbi:MAG: hypothetical protein M3R70_08665 [Actinomycetota bacterium]|nr:hypothetical protein [Actinomycetota bacterium]